MAQRSSLCPITLALLLGACSSQAAPQDEPTGGTGGGTAGGAGAAAAGRAGGGASGSQAGATAGAQAGTGGTPSGGAAGTDESPRDAGAAGAGGAGGQSAQGGAAGGPTPASCGALALCEDFEGYTPGPLTGTTFSFEAGKPSDFAIATDQAHSGKYAVKVADAMGDRLLRISGVDAKTNGGKSVFVRAWFYFPQLPKVSRPGEEPHSRLVKAFEVAPTNKGTTVSAGLAGTNKGRLLYYSDGGGSGKRDCASDGGTLPAGKWTCVELRTDLAGYAMWIDGQQTGGANSASGANCWEAHDRVASVGFGFQMAAGTIDAPYTFYLDDVAVDTKRIGCGK